jgi:hypothetical protein
MTSTANFNPTDDPKLLCTCGHKKCDKRSVKQSILDRVQYIREDADRPLIITSAGRCPYHPNEVHRTKPADHQNCIAVDIFYSTVLERNELMVLAGRYGANAVAAGKNFVHIAWREDVKDRIATWEYN